MRINANRRSGCLEYELQDLRDQAPKTIGRLVPQRWPREEPDRAYWRSPAPAGELAESRGLATSPLAAAFAGVAARVRGQMH